MSRVEALQVVLDDITGLSVDVIVNAANERMLGGGGVDGAIHAHAGPELLAACRAVPEVRPGVRCPTGQARITPAFRLPARFVVHTVGPVWHGGAQGEPTALAGCYHASLLLAQAHGATSIAFPSISTGAFSYPRPAAAAIAVRVCRAFLEEHAAFERILLVAYSAADYATLQQAVSDSQLGLEN